LKECTIASSRRGRVGGLGIGSGSRSATCPALPYPRPLPYPSQEREAGRWGRRAMWLPRCARRSDCPCVCVRDCVRVRGCVGAWVRGCVGAWVRGCVGAWVRCMRARARACVSRVQRRTQSPPPGSAGSHAHTHTHTHIQLVHIAFAGGRLSSPRLDRGDSILFRRRGQGRADEDHGVGVGLGCGRAGDLNRRAAPRLGRGPGVVEGAGAAPGSLNSDWF
jgi:hypothetical protein